MLKPITKEEKLSFTLKLQAEIGTNELLADLYEEKYRGFVDIWPVIQTKNNKIILEMRMQKVPLYNSPKTNQDCERYEVVPEKGVRKLKGSS